MLLVDAYHKGIKAMVFVDIDQTRERSKCYMWMQMS